MLQHTRALAGRGFTCRIWRTCDESGKGPGELARNGTKEKVDAMLTQGRVCLLICLCDWKQKKSKKKIRKPMYELWAEWSIRKRLLKALRVANSSSIQLQSDNSHRFCHALQQNESPFPKAGRPARGGGEGGNGLFLSLRNTLYSSHLISH